MNTNSLPTFDLQRFAPVFMQAISSPLGIFDDNGKLCFINQAWQHQAQTLLDPLLSELEVGQNILSAYKQLPEGQPVQQAADRVRRLLAGPDKRLTFQYQFIPETTAKPAAEAAAQPLIRLTVITRYETDERCFAVLVLMDTTQVLASVIADLEQQRETEFLTQHANQMEALELLAAPTQTPVTASSFGLHALEDSQPEIFQQLVQRYSALLDLALEEKAFKVNHRVSPKLQELVQALGFNRAGPRDVINLHTHALKLKVSGAPHSKAQAYIDEGQLLVLELMGHLVNFYRNLSFGRRNGINALIQNSTKGSADE